MNSSRFLSLGSLLFAGLFIAPSRAALTTEYLAANGLNFTCSVLKHTSDDPDAPRREILLLHGFPNFRVWWTPLLEHWDAIFTGTTMSTNSLAMPPMSVHAVACDLRGYSPGASPDNIEEYDYTVLAQDAFALAEASGFDDGFHLLGHDHGAGLAWYLAGNDPEQKILSLATFSVPHIGLFADALCGENESEAQVIASNYFNQFSLADSATANNASLTEFFVGLGVPPLDPVQFQKMLWWYNGSLAKHFSMPRVVSDDEVDDYESRYGPELAFFIKGIRAAIPMEERPCIPVEGEGKVGAIQVPTLFICGLTDIALLCNDPYATEFPPELLPNYEHANYKCGHDFFLEGNCVDMDESMAVMEKVTAFLFQGAGANGSSTVDTDELDETSSNGTTTAQDDKETAAPEAGGSSTASSSANRILHLAGRIPLVVVSGGAMLASASLWG